MLKKMKELRKVFFSRVIKPPPGEGTACAWIFRDLKLPALTKRGVLLFVTLSGKKTKGQIETRKFWDSETLSLESF
jgi:hypothetical protein